MDWTSSGISFLGSAAVRLLSLLSLLLLLSLATSEPRFGGQMGGGGRGCTNVIMVTVVVSAKKIEAKNCKCTPFFLKL